MINLVSCSVSLNLLFDEYRISSFLNEDVLVFKIYSFNDTL